MMLVLSRKKNEEIIVDLRGRDLREVVGPDGLLRLTVVEIRGDKVRLGVTGPREIPVHRQEVFLAVERERLEMAAKSPEPADVAPAAAD